MGIFLTKGGGTGGNTPTPQKQTYIQDSFDSLTIQREETGEYILFDITENALLNRQGHNPNFEIPPQITTFFMWTDFENYGKNSLHVVVHNKKGDCFKLNIIPNFSFSEDHPEITIKGEGEIPNDIYFFYDVWTLPNVQNRLIQFYIWSQNGDFLDDEIYLYVETLTDKKNSVPVISEENILQRFYNDEFDFEFDIEPTELINIVGDGDKQNLYIHSEITNLDQNAIFKYPVLSINSKLLIYTEDAFNICICDLSEYQDLLYNNPYYYLDFSGKKINFDPFIYPNNIVSFEPKVEIEGITEDVKILLDSNSIIRLAENCTNLDLSANGEIPFIIGYDTHQFNSTFKNSGLTHGILPKRLSTVGYPTAYQLQNTFEKCHALIDSTIDEHLAYVEDFRYCYYECDNLENVYINNHYTTNLYIRNVDYMFAKCEYLETITFENCESIASPTNQNNAMFQNCTYLTDIYLKNCGPNFVAFIQANAPAGATVTVTNE